MRMRFKPYARPELAAWEHFIDHPAEHIARWKELYTRPRPLRLELGCGKGGFLSALSLHEREYNYLGVDIKSEMLVVAKRNIERLRLENGAPLDNIKLTAHDIERVRAILSPEDEVERIYINFCNPWHKSGHAKHRLTHPRQLIQYRDFLRAGGEIHFKTDDAPLFEDSLRYFDISAFGIRYKTADLHREGGMTPIMTEHERMFSAEGVKIKGCIAVMQPADLEKAYFSSMKII